MNEQILKGNWKKLKGMIKEEWGKFTDDEIDQMDGNYDQLVGKLQEKYGFKKDESREKINSLVKKVKDKH